ncbi:MAG: hypothetical protein LIO44_02930 [Eubacterium sp.]|nr:hypothetical protein [Eubacterium sp.]
MRNKSENAETKNNCITDSEKTIMNTIAGTYERCKAEHIGLNASQLRRLCLDEVIPCVRLGRKILINWDVLMAYINGDNFVPAQPKPVNKLSVTDKPVRKRKIRPVC